MDILLVLAIVTVSNSESARANLIYLSAGPSLLPVTVRFPVHPASHPHFFALRSRPLVVAPTYIKLQNWLRRIHNLSLEFLESCLPIGHTPEKNITRHFYGPIHHV